MNPVKDPGRQPYSRQERRCQDVGTGYSLHQDTQERSPSEGSVVFRHNGILVEFLDSFCTFVVGMILNRRRIKANADLVRVKSKTANKMAQKRLRAASVAMKAGNSELFYQETLNALWGYVSYKLNIAASELIGTISVNHLTRRGQTRR